MVNKGIVTKIIEFSFVDGPGNRMTIFLQGCNFNCGYCHNPETINNCNDCGECVLVCPSSALSFKDQKVICHGENCKDCNLCINTCNFSSTPKTSVLTVDQVFEKIKNFSNFIQGITVSGGECTLQWPFIKELFSKVKTETNLTTFIDSNGHVSEEALASLIGITDGFMLDIKAVNDDVHQYITEEGNKRVIENIQNIFNAGKLYELRYVILPNINDGYEDISLLGKLILSLDPKLRLLLIPFRNFGVKGKFKDHQCPTEEELKGIRGELEKMGLQNVKIKN